MREIIRAQIPETTTLFKTEFEGIVTPNNNGGEHKFNAIIPDEDKYNELMEKGFYIKKYESAKDGTIYFIPIFVSYRHYIPNVTMVFDGVQRRLDEDTIKELDNMTITKCRVQFTLSIFEWHGKEYRRAYLDNGYFYVVKKVVEDPFANIVAEELENMAFEP
jgi:hypothetical protein